MKIDPAMMVETTISRIQLMCTPSNVFVTMEGGRTQRLIAIDVKKTTIEMPIMVSLKNRVHAGIGGSLFMVNERIAFCF